MHHPEGVMGLLLFHFSLDVLHAQIFLSGSFAWLMPEAVEFFSLSSSYNSVTYSLAIFALSLLRQLLPKLYSTQSYYHCLLLLLLSR